jgi:hypothetical protein
VKHARATTLRVAGLAAAGVPADLSALALPRGADPVMLAFEAPLIRWHRENWLSTYPQAGQQDVLSKGLLERVVHKAREQMPQGLGWEFDTPAHGAVRAARAVGWELISAGVLAHGECTIMLSGTSPAALKVLYRQRWEAHKMATALQLRLQSLQASLADNVKGQH